MATRRIRRGSDAKPVPKLMYHLGRVLGDVATARAEAFFKRFADGSADPSEHIKIVKDAGKEVGALYIHIPFCHRPLCMFCCFVKYPYDFRRYRSYMSALKKEIEWLASCADGAKVRIVYVGGGTPSIDVYELSEVIDSLRGCFGGGLDVSVEASPLDVNDETVSVLRSAKVTRLSIGVQALDDKRLVELGRLHHTVKQSLRAVEAARSKFDTLNIDILWGVRGDTIERIREEAGKALSLRVDQVTFYPLMPAPGLRELMRRRAEGPWHPLDAELYEEIVRESVRHGYAPSTAWCMSRGSRLVDEYVIDYDKFFALGVSGIGKLGGYSYANTFSIEKYIRLVEERGFSAIRAVRVGPLEDMLYYASTQIFGLRFCPSKLSDRYGRLGARFSRLLAVAMRMLGERPGRDGCFHPARAQALYLVHAMQRGIYMGVNAFREWGLRTQA